MNAPVNIAPKRGYQWAVWCKTDGMPREFFATHDLAVEFAIYQAQRRPGSKFHVVNFNCKVSVPRVNFAAVADAAHDAALDSEADLDSTEAAVCREVEADARGLALIERAKDYGLVPERAA